MLKVMGASDAVRYIHLGWILALIAGGLTWVATQTFLTFSGQNRESMEGFISVFAAVALFLCRLLAAHEIRSQEVANVHPRQSGKCR